MPFLKLEYDKQPLAGETPRHLFEHVQGKYSCLLESGKNGRYSYIGYDPFTLLWSYQNTIQAIQLKDFFGHKRDGRGQILEDSPSWSVEDFLGQFEFKGEAPVPFCGGAAGYISYDFGARFVGMQQKVFDDTEIPEYMFGVYDKVIAFDHEEGQLYYLALAETDLAAKRKIEEIKEDLLRPTPLRRKGSAGALTSNLVEDSYVRKVEQIKELLRKGETYQVNFSQRFSGDCSLHPLAVYNRLADRNPSPFACYFEYQDFSIVSCSPELLLRKRASKLETWPIKGTVPRGGDDEEDERNVKKLLESQKDEAELSMITDLSRNDLGKVCTLGSVHVDAHRDVEKYSHVIHTVSRVSGQLQDKVLLYDCLQALFPGGSVTGCPKKRTMEIIDQMEDYKRGVYTGSAGFVSFSGESDFNILIRTMLLKDGKVYFHAGGGIVMDSDPAKEYQETLDKVEALRLSLDSEGS